MKILIYVHAISPRTPIWLLFSFGSWCWQISWICFSFPQPPGVDWVKKKPTKNKNKSDLTSIVYICFPFLLQFRLRFSYINQKLIICVFFIRSLTRNFFSRGCWHMPFRRPRGYRHSRKSRGCGTPFIRSSSSSSSQECFWNRPVRQV